MLKITLFIAACLSFTVQVEAKTSDRIQLHPLTEQIEKWQNGVQYVDDRKPASVVRILIIEDDLPGKQSTFRVLVLNKSNIPITFGPENVSIQYGAGKSVMMASRDDLQGKLRRDIKRRQALALLGNAFSSQAADGQTRGNFDFNGTNAYGGQVSGSGTYSNYNHALAQQQQRLIQEQAEATNRAIQARQLSGQLALNSMIQKSTVQPQTTFGGIVAYDAPSSFHKDAKSGPVKIIVNVGGEIHSFQASFSKN